MGDRSNVVIETAWNEDPTRVYLYSHWGGEDVLDAALHGLASQRVDDPSYLARIIFCSIVKGDEDGETGYGISATITDNEHPLLVVSCRRRETVVYFEDDASRQLTPAMPAEEFRTRVTEYEAAHPPKSYERYEKLIAMLNGQAGAKS